MAEKQRVIHPTEVPSTGKVTLPVSDPAAFIAKKNKARPLEKPQAVTRENAFRKNYNAAIRELLAGGKTGA